MTSLALSTWLPTLDPETGLVTIGAIEAPAEQWRDMLARAWEVCGEVPTEVSGRVRCREHLDAMFQGAGVVRCWPTGSKQLGVNLPAVWDGRRCTVRLGDTSVAVLLDHGTYHQGPMCQYREDSIFGCVAEMVSPMVRFSARGTQVLALPMVGP